MIKVGIIGASGYSGAELLRLLLSHPEVEITYLTANQYAGKKVSTLYPNLAGICDLSYSAYDLEKALKNCDVLFVALPHGKPMEIIPDLIVGKKKIIDLSGDFRLTDSTEYRKWYGFEHSSPDLLGTAVYGLTEVNREKIRKADFVANPGCYPTGVILGLAPLLAEKLIAKDGIVIDSLSGVSGSGRAPGDDTHYCYCDENVSVYKVGGVHQHIPEMEQELTKIAGGEVKIAFTPHLAPFSRGIYSTIYGKLKKDQSSSRMVELFKDFYAGEYFVEVLEDGVFPQVKAVAG
jgi:N-acetyl-gamma-glutamyl-phosphate reductase